MPTFSSDQFNAFKEAFSSVSSHFFSVFTEIINWIRSSPVVFYAVALPIGGAVFVLVFLFIRSLVDRDYSGGLGEAPMWGRELSGSMSGAALMMRKLYRSRGKAGKGKKSGHSHKDGNGGRSDNGHRRSAGGASSSGGSERISESAEKILSDLFHLHGFSRSANASNFSTDELLEMLGSSREELREEYMKPKPYQKSINIGGREILTRNLDISVDDEDLQQ